MKCSSSWGRSCNTIEGSKTANGPWSVKTPSQQSLNMHVAPCNELNRINVLFSSIHEKKVKYDWSLNTLHVGDEVTCSALQAFCIVRLGPVLQPNPPTSASATAETDAAAAASCSPNLCGGRSWPHPLLAPPPPWIEPNDTPQEEKSRKLGANLITSCHPAVFLWLYSASPHFSV